MLKVTWWVPDEHWATLLCTVQSKPQRKTSKFISVLVIRLTNTLADVVTLSQWSLRCRCEFNQCILTKVGTGVDRQHNFNPLQLRWEVVDRMKDGGKRSYRKSVASPMWKGDVIHDIQRKESEGKKRFVNKFPRCDTKGFFLPWSVLNLFTTNTGFRLILVLI